MKKPPFWSIWLGWFVGSALDIVCGAVSILTLCYCYPQWSMNWRFWIAKKQMELAGTLHKS